MKSKSARSRKAGGYQKLNLVFKGILEEIRPTAEEIAALNEYSNELMGRLRKVVPRNVEIILAGSVARGTQIRGTSDIDIFMLFPKGTAEREMERKAIELAKKVVRHSHGESFVINYAEHPYLKLISEKFEIKADIVPAFKIRDSSEMATAVDRTQLHNQFVMANLSEAQKDHVRLLKYILREHNIYGAEARVRGFSGYLCELLVHTFGDITKTLEFFASVKRPCLIEPLSKSVSNSESAKEASQRFRSNFIVIDPTDPDRNVAASVSDESLLRASLVSYRILEEQSAKVISRYGFSDDDSFRRLESIEKATGLKIYTLRMRLPKISDDTLWPQIVKLSGQMVHFLESYSFKPVIALQEMGDGDGVIAFFMDRQSSSIELVRGPPGFMHEDSIVFYKKHVNKEMDNVSFDGERIFALEEARYKTPEEAIRAALNSKSFKFPSYIKKKSTVLYGKEIPEACAKLVYRAYIRKMTI